MDDRRREALLRLYSGESPEHICIDLSITMEELANWDRTTEPSQLRPDEATYISTTLSPPRPGAPRTDLGLRVGPPDRPAAAVQRVHVIAGPSEAVCLRCGEEVVPRSFEPHCSAWPALVLTQEAPEGSAMCFITDEEAEFFPPCEQDDASSPRSSESS